MTRPDRRHFLRAAAAATAASYSRILGANDRIRIGAIGTGGRCQYLLSLLNKIGGDDITAICDVYEPRRLEARAQYAAQAREFADYRKVLELADIDAVVIGTPDHWHAPMVIQAVAAGKHVYVEKPVTHRIEEGDALQKAVDDSKRVVQSGMQQRSWPHFAQARELIRSGELGQITFVHTYWYQKHIREGGGKPNVDPAKLDWKMWLGSAPGQPFDAERYAEWRWFWDFGGGALTDLFVHWVDVVHWLMDSDTPLTAQAMGNTYAIPSRECPDTISAVFEYPGRFLVDFDCTLIGYLEGGGLVFRGTKGMLRLHRGGFTLYPEVTQYTELPDLKDVARQVTSGRDGGYDHMQNFLDCIRGGKEPNAPISAGIAAARAGHLGNLAMRGKQPVRVPQ